MYIGTKPNKNMQKVFARFLVIAMVTMSVTAVPAETDAVVRRQPGTDEFEVGFLNISQYARATYHFRAAFNV